MVGMLLVGLGFYLRAKLFADKAQNFQIAGGSAIGWVVVTFIWRIFLIGELDQIEDGESLEAFVEAIIVLLILILVSSILLFVSGYYIRDTLQGGGTGFYIFSLVNLIGSASIVLIFLDPQFVVIFLVKLFLLPIIGLIIFSKMAFVEDSKLFLYPYPPYRYQQQHYQQQPYQQQPYQEQPPPQQSTHYTTSHSPLSDGMDASPVNKEIKALDAVMCLTCGAENNSSFSFCGTCGTKMDN